MKYLLESDEFKDEVKYEVKKRSSYTHKKSGRYMQFSHEYFAIKIDNKICASCIITYPNKSPTKSMMDGNPAYTIYTGGEEIFDDKNVNFVKLYDVRSRKTGKGFGKILFDNLLEYLLSKGIEKVYIDVLEENKLAQKFYERLGFKIKYKSSDNIGYYLIIK